jgi:hypothetical protein
MTDTTGGTAPASPSAPSPPSPPSTPASSSPPSPRPSAPPNPRSTGYSPARDRYAEIRAAQGQTQAPGVADGTGDQQPAPPAAPQTPEQELADLRTRVAADAVRKAAFDAALPTPDAYRAELPSDFKPPAGLEIKIDTADPAYVQFKQLAHQYRLPQEAFSKFLGIKAGMDVGTQASIDAARAAEVAKLGGAGPARIDNLVRLLDGNGLGVLKASLVTAAQVEALESFFARQETQGVGRFSQSHRAAPDDQKIPGYEGMTFEQRRFAQDLRAAARRGRE